MEKGWHCVDYEWEEIWECGIGFEFEYQGKSYWCCNDQNPNESYIYTLPDYEKIATFAGGKDGFYSAALFGRPFKEVVDDSYLSYTG